MIFKINFFLFTFAQANIFSYTFVYAKYYANVDEQQYGVLSLVLPALALFAKPISCSIADSKVIHKQFLIGALCVFATSYGLLGFIPYMKDPNDHEHDGIVWAALWVLYTFGYIATVCIFCMNDALASNYARKHNIPYGQMRIWCNLGWAAGALFILVTSYIDTLPFKVKDIIILVIATALDVTVLCMWPYDEDFEMFHDGSTIDQRKLSIPGPNTLALISQNKQRGSISHDMLEKIRSGRSKSTSNLPRFTDKLKPPNASDLLSHVNNDEKEKKSKEYSNFQIQMILVKMISSKHKSFVRYLSLFTIFGFVQGIFWTYQFAFLKSQIPSDDFDFISTACMVAQSLIGDIPINMIANHMVRLFGANANMSLALVVLGLRCFFYGTILPYVNPRFAILAEAFQGPSLGLYWILIVDVGSHYALMVTDFMPELKKRGIVRDKEHEEEINSCLRASMIGFMSASMEGLGGALGGFIGGVAITRFTYGPTWIACALLCVIVGFSNIGWDIARKLVFVPKKSGSEELSQQPPEALQRIKAPTIVIDDETTSKL